MDKYDALWTYQTEDMKADAITAAIRNSPVRQKLEKARDFILDRQKQYKQIEDEIASMLDRKEIIAQAVSRAEAQINALQQKYSTNPPESAEDVRALLSEVSKCRDTIRQYEAEISRIVSDTTAHDKLQRTVRLEAAKAKQDFDQLKTEYETESRTRKEELEVQRTRVKELAATVDPGLLEEYNVIKRHVSPPVAKLTWGQCSGCNTSLPSAVLSKIRNGTMVECETCGRIIIQLES